MKKLILAAVFASVLVPTMATAQSAREVRDGRQEVLRDRREVRTDIARGDRNEARRDRQELREDRQELREDWRDYRNSHRNLYRGTRYVAPRGYNYRPVAIGAQLNRALYASNYRVNNWSQFRLPRPGFNQQYIRYGNDVLLVNVRTGRVVQVFRSFYW